jgi:hypothetical protein
MRARLILIALAALLAACGTPTAPLSPTPAPTQQPGSVAVPLTAKVTVAPTPAPQVTQTLPFVSNGTFRVLFINGDHTPENGYPHSRVRDDGSKPESFSQLRTRVLEQELKLAVDEFILSAGNAITPGLLAPYRVVTLGSNGRRLNTSEVAALTHYLETGGRILIYADYQYGPDNWASDNGFLMQFGIEVFPDNFQPTTVITDLVSTHPIMTGVGGFATEGSSQFLISAASLVSTTVLSRCSPLERSGCAVQAPERAKIRPGDVVACTWIRENTAGGRIAGTCDRNTFHNGPGVGTALSEFDNQRYARNLFAWLTQ